MAALDAVDQAENTIILFVSDHGDMLGERGLWFKMNFFKGSARVPLMISAPKMPVGRIDHPVSTLDVLPTLAELAGINMDEIMPWTDGRSLVSSRADDKDIKPVRMEYAAEASNAPLVALRQGQWKYIHCELDPPQLYDLDADPHELNNLAADPSFDTVTASFAKAVAEEWDLTAYDSEIRQSQARRWVVYEALRNGAYYPWDYQPLLKASERYMRNHMDLNIVEERQRYPGD
jgi:choline-sulfatase